MNLKFFILLFSFSLFAKDSFVGEVLTYQAGFRFFSAGEAILSFSSDTLAGDSVYSLNADINTNPFLDRFYKVRDNIKIWMSPIDYSLLKVEKNILEGNYKKSHKAEIDYFKNIINFGKKKLIIDEPVFGPLSIIYKIREEINFKNIPFLATIYDMGKLKPVLFKVDKMESINVPYGSFECIVVSPHSVDNKKLLKNDGRMKVWFTKDENHIPIKIEQSTNIGIMVMELKELSFN